MWCPNCGSEYRRGIAVCNDCHIALVHEDPRKEIKARSRPPRDPSKDDVRTVRLGRFDPLEAPVIIDMLADRGIFAFDKLPGEPVTTWNYAEKSGAGEIMVDASRLDEAKHLVATLLPVILREMQQQLEQEFEGNA